MLGEGLSKAGALALLPSYTVPVLSEIPFLGAILFTRHSVMVYIGYFLIPAAWLFINRTRPGMHLRAIGEFPEPGEEASATRRDDGSWLFDGTVAIEDVEEAFGAGDLGDPDGETYETVAGLVLHRLGRIPRTGQSVTFRGLRFEVVDMDGPRVDKVLVSALPPKPA